MTFDNHKGPGWVLQHQFHTCIQSFDMHPETNELYVITLQSKSVTFDLKDIILTSCVFFFFVEDIVISLTFKPLYNESQNYCKNPTATY